MYLCPRKREAEIVLFSFVLLFILIMFQVFFFLFPFLLFCEFVFVQLFFFCDCVSVSYIRDNHDNNDGSKNDAHYIVVSSPSVHCLSFPQSLLLQARHTTKKE